MDRTRQLHLARLLALLTPALLLGGAYVSQYGFGLYPCEMCWWQRYPHFAALALALAAFMVKGPAAQRLFAALAALAIMTSGVIGAFHAGVEYGWWEGVTACTSAVGGGGDIMDAIMNAPLIRCDIAPWTLMGISLAGYNFLLSASAAILIVILVLKSERAAR